MVQRGVEFSRDASRRGLENYRKTGYSPVWKAYYFRRVH